MRNLMVSVRLLLPLWAFMLILSTRSYAVTLDFDVDGQLIAACGVQVVGYGSYDVQFAEGPPEGWYSSRDGHYEFDFDTYREAVAAATALSGQVINIIENVIRDGYPAMNYALTRDRLGIVVIPYGIAQREGIGSVDGGYVLNYDATDWNMKGMIDIVPHAHAMNLDFEDASYVYSRWAPSAQKNVPVPPTIMLLGSGLLGMAGVIKKRSKKVM